MSDSDEVKKQSRDRYRRFAERYVGSPSHAKGADLDRILELASPQPDWRVLDVATGGGHTALKLAPWVRLVVASDLTAEMLHAAKSFLAPQKVGHFSFTIADAEALPFATGSFDLVTCRIAPHHFPDPGRFVEQAARVVRTGGMVLIQDHLLPDDFDAGRRVDDFERRRDPSHVRAFSRSDWLAMFDSAGLSVQSDEEIIKRHDLIPWVDRQGGSEGTINDLRSMLAAMPPAAQSWLQPQMWDTPQASFVNHHVIIAGRK